MLKKGVLALALFIGMPVFAAEHWIDVRVPDQYQQEHIQGAVNIPLKDLKAQITSVVPDKTDTVKLYCNSGRQSGQAKDMLIDMGYTKVTNEGGIKQIDLPKVEQK
ncbi:thiosulfate sulfurtransferase PspE [Escherichia coli]|nr:thiosulfate sulfurtransferase PspE [Escherichia coli]